MDVTNVKVEFSIIGDVFSPDKVTEKLEILPSKTRLKGELLGNGRPFHQTEWSIETEYEESYDINNQLKKVVELIKNKVDVINEVHNLYNTKCVFIIAVNVENDDKPAMYFKSDFIDFANKIRAEIGFDLFIY